MGKESNITLKQIQEILRDKIERTILHSRHFVSDTNTFIESEVKKRIEEVENDEELLKTRISDNYELVLEHIEKEIDGILRRKDLSVDKKSLEFKELRKQFLELRLVRNQWKKELLGQSERTVEDFRTEIFKKLNLSEETPISSEPIPISVPTQEPFEETDSSQSDSPKISQVRDEFISERLVSGFSPKSTSELESTITDLIEIVGDIPIGTFSHSQSRDFKNVISKLPKHRKQDPRYRDLSIKQILMLDNLIGQQPKNINKLLYRVRIFFKWLTSNYREYVKENYFVGMKVSDPKVHKPRDGFTNEELSLIFKPPNFFSYNIRNPYNRIKLPKYWVPLIGLHSGMRLDEICQLRVEDVKKDGKYDIFEIKQTDETKTKNIQSERIVPIHENLKKLGFIDYCEFLRKKGYERIFHDLNKDRDGYGRNISRTHTSFLKRIGIHVEQSKVFHSYRHTFITNLLQNGVREEIVNGLDGHKQKTMSTTIYFKGGFPSEVLYEEGISKLKFEGINFGKLKIDWRKYLS